MFSGCFHSIVCAAARADDIRETQGCRHGGFRSAWTGNQADRPAPCCKRRYLRGSQRRLCLDSGWLRITAHSLLLAAALAGCTRPPPRIEAIPAPLYHIEPAILRTIDEQILAASVYARHESGAHARIAMDEWRERVRKRTVDVFIPWYSDYWTQQWIATRVAWSKLEYTEGGATPEERLTGYLQEQFYTRVLEPVSGFVDPHAVMDETTDRYLQELKCQLDTLPFEYGIPEDAFNRHLDTIPAIVVQAQQEVSLHELLQAADRSALPAYATLLVQIAAVNDGTGPQPSPDRLHAVARSAVTRLVDSLTVRGGATATATVVGGFWGILISVGAGVWGVLEHDHDKPVIEAQLLENLDAALEVMWQGLVEDQDGGVTAVVHHISQQIECAVTPPSQTPLIPSIPVPTELF